MPNRLTFGAETRRFVRIALVSMATVLCCQTVRAADRGEQRTRAKAKAAVILSECGVTDNGDVKVLTKYYRSLGFFEAKVGRMVDFESGSFQLAVESGPRYRVKAITLSGNQRFTDADLAKQLKTTAGGFFSQADLDADLATIGKLYDRPGEKVQAELRFGDEPGELETVFKITEVIAPE